MKKQAFIKIMILATVIMMDILGGAEVDLFVPSFPELKSQFNLTPFWVEALLSVNFIGTCLSLLFVGNLADRYGRKPIILLGSTVFMIGSLLCVWAPSYHFLLVGRFLQGIGVAAPASLCFLIVTDLYPLKKQQRLMAVLNGVMNLSVAAAPVAGSYIALYFHWQGNFVALVVIGFITLLMTFFFIPHDQPAARQVSMSLRGYLPVLQSSSLMLLIIHVAFICVPYWVFLGMSSMLYIKDLGVSISQYGFYQGTWAFVFALGNILFGFVISKLNPNKLLFTSGYFLIMSMVLVAYVTYIDSRDPLLITLALIPFSISTIIPTTILYPVCLNVVPAIKGRVSAIVSLSRLVLSALGLEIAGYFYQGSFRNIGLVITCFILVAIITLFMVLHNHELIKFSRGGSKQF